MGHIKVVRLLTRRAGAARISGPRLRAGRVGDARGVCCIHSSLGRADLAAGLLPRHRSICAPLAAAAATGALGRLEGARMAGVHRPEAVLEVARPGHCSEGNKGNPLTVQVW